MDWFVSRCASSAPLSMFSASSTCSQSACDGTYLEKFVQLGEVLERAQTRHIHFDELQAFEAFEELLVLGADLLDVFFVENQLGDLQTAAG